MRADQNSSKKTTALRDTLTVDHSHVIVSVLLVSINYICSTTSILLI
jgi:hypothetical protein